MNPVLKQFQKIGIIPVIALHDAADAAPLAKALIDGGLPCAEITFRTDAAEESIRIMSSTYPDMLVGAGTVLTTNQVDRAIAAGAKFIVSPGLNPKIVEYCQSMDIPITPGCSNPSDVEVALEFGLEVVKFFPAEASGGLELIKAMSAPYHQLLFMPTGGINPKNINTYLSFNKIIACGGSWMVSNELIQAKDWDQIRLRTQEAVKTMLGFTLKHVGINQPSEDAALALSKEFASFFQVEESIGNSSIFINDCIEVTKQIGRGTLGHLAIGTNSVDRAVYQLEKNGFSFAEDSKLYTKDGTLKVIYLDQEIGGFAIHFVLK